MIYYTLMNMEKWKPYAPLAIRIGLAIILLLFGYHKLNPLTVSQGRGEIEIIFGFPLTAAAPINYYVGLFEVITGSALLLGWRIARTALLATGLIGAIFAAITISIGWNTQDTTLIKDVALTGAGFALWILGAGAISIDAKKGTQAQSYIPQEYAPLVIRLTTGGVLLFLGYEAWRVGSMYMGILELITGSALILGLFTRYAGLISAGIFTYLMCILISGFPTSESLAVINDPTRFRDAGIIGASLALFLLGPGKWSIMKK